MRAAGFGVRPADCVAQPTPHTRPRCLAEAREALLQLTPASYVGNAAAQARAIRARLASLRA